MWQVDIAFVCQKKSSTIIPCLLAEFTSRNVSMDKALRRGCPEPHGGMEKGDCSLPRGEQARAWRRMGSPPGATAERLSHCGAEGR